MFFRRLLGQNQITVNLVVGLFYGTLQGYLNANNLDQDSIIVDHVAELCAINVVRKSQLFHAWAMNFQSEFVNFAVLILSKDYH